jgi:hypothetical protein
MNIFNLLLKISRYPVPVTICWRIDLKTSDSKRVIWLLYKETWALVKSPIKGTTHVTNEKLTNKFEKEEDFTEKILTVKCTS